MFYLVLIINNFNALFNLGLVYSVKKDHKKAIAYFDKTLEINPTSFGVLYNKAGNFEILGENKKAAKLYQNPLEYLPPNFANYKEGVLQKIKILLQ